MNARGVQNSLNSNESLRFVFLHINQLSGTIPGYDNMPILQRLRLNQNKFTGLEKFTLPKLFEFRAHINQITGAIPTFVDCPNLRFITLYSNKFTSYTPGAIAQNYNLRLFNVEGNQLEELTLKSFDISFDPAIPTQANMYFAPDTPNANYQIRVTVQDKSGNLAESPDINFQIDEPVKVAKILNIPNPIKNQTFFDLES